jgi:cytochrome c oxidase subunit IV
MMSTKQPIGLPTYFAVFTALLVLTGITVWVAFQDFGVFNNVIALAIAVIKSTLVVLFFMHVLHSTPLTKLVLVISVFFFLILVAFVYSDVWTRGMLELPNRPPMIGG